MRGASLQAGAGRRPPIRVKHSARGILADSGVRGANSNAALRPMTPQAMAISSPRAAPRCMSSAAPMDPSAVKATMSAVTRAEPAGERPWISIRKVGNHAINASHWIEKSTKQAPNSQRPGRASVARNVGIDTYQYPVTSTFHRKERTPTSAHAGIAACPRTNTDRFFRRSSPNSACGNRGRRTRERLACHDGSSMQWCCCPQLQWDTCERGARLLRWRNVFCDCREFYQSMC